VKNITVLDEANIFMLPAELVKYGTWAGIEIGGHVSDFNNPAGGNGATSFGFHYNFNPTTVLAVYGSNMSRGTHSIDGVSQGPGFPSDGDAGATHKGSVMLGLDFGSARLGIGLGVWADSTYSQDDTRADATVEGPLVIDFTIGLGVAIGASDLDMALDVYFGSPTHFGDKGDGGEVLSNNSEFGVGLLGRMTIPFSGPHELVPFLKVGVRLNNGQLTGDDQDLFDGFGWGLNLGMDIRLNLAEGITVQPGIGFAFGQESVQTTPGNQDLNITKVTNGEHAMPYYNLAVDVQVTDWLDIRFGGSQEIVFKTNEPFDVTDAQIPEGQGPSGESDVRHKLTTGVGIQMPAGVSLDIEVATSWWQSGPYFITGTGGGFGVSAALSKDW